jgi:hypothetical protein
MTTFHLPGTEPEDALNGRAVHDRKEKRHDIPGRRLRPGRTAPLPLRAGPVGGRGDGPGVVGGRDRLHGGRRRAASDRTELAYRLPGPAVDRHELHAHPGLADSPGRLAQRPLGAAAGVPGRTDLVHPGVGAVRGRGRHRMAHRRAGRAGGRRRADDTSQPGDHRGDLPARRPHARDRDVGRIQRGVRRDRALPGRVAAGSRQLAVDLPDQRPCRCGDRVGDVAARSRIQGHVGVRENRLARRARRRHRAGRDNLRGHRCAWRGRHLAAVCRRRGARPGVLRRLRRRGTAREPSHAPADDLPARAVPRRECRHLRRQRRPRRLRVRLHPRPGDHRRLQPGRGRLGTGPGHRRDLAAVGGQRPAGPADRPPAAASGGLPAVRGRVPARRAHRPARRLLDGRISAGLAIRPWPGVPHPTPDRQCDELRA